MTDSNAALSAEARPAIVPGRLRAALSHVVDDAVPEAFATELGRWLFTNRERMFRAGDEHGQHRFEWRLPRLDDAAPDLCRVLRARLLDELQAAGSACRVPDFDLLRVEMDGSLIHHGGSHGWHNDTEDDDTGDLAPYRRLGFALFAVSEPKMFSGGELEFLDGTMIEPKDRRLVFWHPVQSKRIRPVSCWSGHVLHGRWSITGWLCGEAPAGWADRIDALRAV